MAEVAEHPEHTRGGRDLLARCAGLGAAKRVARVVRGDPASDGGEGLALVVERGVEQVTLVAHVAEVGDRRQRLLGAGVAEAERLLRECRAELAGHGLRVVGALVGGHRGGRAIHAVELAVAQVFAELLEGRQGRRGVVRVEHRRLFRERAADQPVDTTPAFGAGRIHRQRLAERGRLDEGQARDVADFQRLRKLLVDDVAHRVVGGRDLRRCGRRDAGHGRGAFGQQPVGGVGDDRDTDVLVDLRHDRAHHRAFREGHIGILALFVVGGLGAAAQLEVERALVGLAGVDGDHAVGGIGLGRAEHGAVFEPDDDQRVAELAEIAAAADTAVTVGAGPHAAVTAARGFPVEVEAGGHAGDDGRRFATATATATTAEHRQGQHEGRQLEGRVNHDPSLGARSAQADCPSPIRRRASLSQAPFTYNAASPCHVPHSWDASSREKLTGATARSRGCLAAR